MPVKANSTAEDDGAGAPHPGYNWRVGVRRRRAREKLRAGRRAEGSPPR